MFIHVMAAALKRKEANMYTGIATTGYEYECPVCGHMAQMCTTTTMMMVNSRRSSKQEIQSYQKLYGDLVEHVDHYKG